MGYVVTGAIVVAIAVAWWLISEALRENRPMPRPRMPAGFRTARRPAARAAGGTCVCGGVIGPTGQELAQFGPVLGCTGCARLWTASGRRIRRRQATPTV